MADLTGGRPALRADDHPAPARGGFWRWTLPVVWLAGIACGAALVACLWHWVRIALVAVLAAGAVIWVLVSVLSPAVPDRTCPRCHGKGLVKIRRGRLGVRCELCDFRDEERHVAYLDEW